MILFIQAVLRHHSGEGNGNHSSVLARRIPGTGEPVGSHRVGHDWRDSAAVPSLLCWLVPSCELRAAVSWGGPLGVVCRLLIQVASLVAEAQAPGHTGFSCGSQGQDCRLNCCGPRAELLCGTWDLPRSGTEPVSPALTGRFFTTEPPGKPWRACFRNK